MKTSAIEKTRDFPNTGCQKSEKKLKYNVKWVLTDYMFNKVNPNMT